MKASEIRRAIAGADGGSPDSLDTVGPQGTSLQLSVAKDLRLVTTVRRFVQDLCMRVIGQADITSRVVVATHELLDNAVRHAAASLNNPQNDGEHARIRVTLRRGEAGAEVMIVTTNHISHDHRERLSQALEGMKKGSSDRQAYYGSLLSRAATEQDVGVGLGRVFAECDMDVTGRFDGDVASIVAEACYRLDGARL